MRCKLSQHKREFLNVYCVPNESTKCMRLRRDCANRMAHLTLEYKDLGLPTCSRTIGTFHAATGTAPCNLWKTHHCSPHSPTQRHKPCRPVPGPRPPRSPAQAMYRQVSATATLTVIAGPVLGQRTNCVLSMPMTRASLVPQTHLGWQGLSPLHAFLLPAPYRGGVVAPGCSHPPQTTRRPYNRHRDAQQPQRDTGGGGRRSCRFLQASKVTGTASKDYCTAYPPLKP